MSNYDLKDIIHTITIYVEQVIDGKNIIKIGPTETLCGNGLKLFYKKEYYFNGDCFATVLPDCVIEAGPLEVVFEFYDKTDIFIHHFGQFLSPNSRSRVDVDKGKFVKIAVNISSLKIILAGVTHGFENDGAKHFQTRAIVANFSISPKNLTKMMQIPKN